MHWVTLILGIWVLISPWLLGFAGIAAGLWSNIIVGLLLVIVSIWGLSTNEA
ncbi:SPW repeat protein [Candidatus Berkelbacteria bacterium]|nr:SPW repeat protein [Candidatus Berkelbacteria bacterium]